MTAYLVFRCVGALACVNDCLYALVVVIKVTQRSSSTCWYTGHKDVRNSLLFARERSLIVVSGTWVESAGFVLLLWLWRERMISF